MNLHEGSIRLVSYEFNFRNALATFPESSSLTIQSNMESRSRTSRLAGRATRLVPLCDMMDLATSSSQIVTRMNLLKRLPLRPLVHVEW